MPTIAPLRLIVATLFTASFAFAAPPDSPGTSKSLPASSPYGEATAIKNIPYATNPAPRQNFDLYLPKGQGDGPFPLIVWIHGGAWMLGQKDWDNVQYLVRHGYAIASVDYRFSTDAVFPAQIQDCNAALNFILAHAVEYKINPKQVVIGGGSAGGHLALLLGLARQEKDFGADPAFRPAAILDFFGPADFNAMLEDLKTVHSDSGLKLFKDVVPKLLGTSVDQPSDKAKVASPINYVTKDSAPILILHGGKDESVPLPQSQHLHEALDKAGVKNQLIIVEAAGHDGPLFATPDIQTKVVAFLDEIFPKAAPVKSSQPD